MNKLHKALAVSATVLFSSCGGDKIIEPPFSEARLTLTPGDTVIVQTGVTTRVRFVATVEGGSGQSITWTRNGSPLPHNGTILELDLGVSTFEICSKVGEVRECSRVTITSAGLPVKVLTARSGPELPAIGLTACIKAESFADECMAVPENGSFTARPSWMDQVQSLKLCITGAKIETVCGDVAREHFLREARFLVFEPEWTIEVGSYAGTVVNISLEKGYQKASDSISSFYKTPSRVAVPTGPVPIKLTGNFTGADTTRIMESMQASTMRIWGVGAKLVTDNTWTPCGSIEIVVDTTAVANTGQPRLCDGVYEGGIIKMMNYVTEGWGMITEHEYVHTLNISHTESWPSIMGVCKNRPSHECIGWLAWVTTSTDVAHIHAMNRLVTLMIRERAMFHPLVSRLPSCYSGC
jgi:hypothetical protein